jgi:hypothetical protein
LLNQLSGASRGALTGVAFADISRALCGWETALEKWQDVLRVFTISGATAHYAIREVVPPRSSDEFVGVRPDDNDLFCGRQVEIERAKRPTERRRIAANLVSKKS